MMRNKRKWKRQRREPDDWNPDRMWKELNGFRDEEQPEEEEL